MNNQLSPFDFESIAMGETCLKVDGDEVFRVTRYGLCIKCGRDTAWVSVSFHGHYCSPDCLNLEWQEYAEALSR